MIANYHTHTWRCNHAQRDERAYIEKAIESGIKILGFADHTPYPFPEYYYSGFRMRVDQLEDYVTTLSNLKREYARDIEIHIGLEVEYYPEYFAKLQELIKPYPIEYMILAQHFVNNEIGEKYSAYRTYSKKKLKRYCDQVIEALETGCFTYVAHPDIFNFRGSKRIYQEEMARICQTAKRLDIPLEINFLGLMENRTYPVKKFWEVVAANGNKVIYGCDAHQVSSVYLPDIEKKARKKFVEPFELDLIDTVELRNPFTL